MAVFAVSVQAQEGWTLRQCIDYAIEHNISIRQSANTVEQSALPLAHNAGGQPVVHKRAPDILAHRQHGIHERPFRFINDRLGHERKDFQPYSFAEETEVA